MKSTIVSGPAIAATAVALVLSGAVTASAGDKPNTPPRTADKPPKEKMACGGKNGCNAAMMGKDMDNGMNTSMDKPGAQSDSKAGSGDQTSGGQK